MRRCGGRTTGANNEEPDLARTQSSHSADGSFFCTAVSGQCFNQWLFFVYAGIRGIRVLPSLIKALVVVVIVRMSRGTARMFPRPAIIYLSRVPVR